LISELSVVNVEYGRSSGSPGNSIESPKPSGEYRFHPIEGLILPVIIPSELRLGTDFELFGCCEKTVSIFASVNVADTTIFVSVFIEIGYRLYKPE